MKKKDLVTSLEPRMITSVTSFKPKLSNTAITEASSSNDAFSVGVSKVDPLEFTDASKSTSDDMEPNLDRPVAVDRRDESPGVMFDDRPLIGFLSFHFQVRKITKQYFGYLESFYEIATSFKVNSNRPVNFDDFLQPFLSFFENLLSS